MKALIVITTVGTEEQANLVAEELVRRRHAACVNMVHVPRTVYRWQGKVCRDSEFMLVVKTTEEEFPQVQDAIRELHNYELPEILGFQVAQGSSDFLSWIADSLDKNAEFSDDEDDGDDLPVLEPTGSN